MQLSHLVSHCLFHNTVLSALVQHIRPDLHWFIFPKVAPRGFAPRGSLSYLSLTTQTHLSRDGTPYKGLGPTTSVSNQENSSDMRNLREAVAQWTALFPGVSS